MTTAHVFQMGWLVQPPIRYSWDLVPQDADFPWQMGRPFRLGLVVGSASNVNYPYLLCFVGLNNDFYESEVVLPKRPY